MVLACDWKEHEARIVRFTTESERTIWGKSHHARGACEVNQNPADFARTLFELRPENTAR